MWKPINWPTPNIDAELLTVLGLYETLELVKWDGGHKYFVEDQFFCHTVKRDTYKVPIALMRKNLEDA